MNLNWRDFGSCYYPMFSFSSSIYDEEELLHEFECRFQEAKLRGLDKIVQDFPVEEPKTVSEYVEFFKKSCLPYQRFVRSPFLTYSFEPDVDALVEAIREDEIYTVPIVHALPKRSRGMALVVSDKFTELWALSETEKGNRADIIWRTSRDWGVRIIEEATDDEEIEE